MSVEFRGDEYLYLVNVDGVESRIFNQTDGSSSIEADSIELATKDKTGSDYGNVTETLSIEGVLTEGDPAIPFLRNAIRKKKLVTITELNTRDLTAETGLYKLDNFEKTNSNGEYSTYSLGASLNGEVTTSTLEEIPDGAPDATEDTEGAEG